MIGKNRYARSLCLYGLAFPLSPYRGTAGIWGELPLPPLLLAAIGPHHHVPAVVLGLVEHVVRDLQVVVVIVPHLGQKGDTADADGDPGGYGRVMGDMEILHCLSDGLQELKGRPGIIAQHNRHELLPAVAPEEVRGALEEGGCRLGHGGDDLIPRRMASRHFKLLSSS